MRKTTSALLAFAAAAVLIPAVAPTTASAQYYNDGYHNDRDGAAVGAARARVKAARDHLRQVVRRERAAFEANPEIIELRRRAQDAERSYNLHRRNVVAALRRQYPEYAQMADRAAALQAQIERQSPGAVMSAGGGTALESGPAGVSVGGAGSAAAQKILEGDQADPVAPVTDDFDNPASTQPAAARPGLPEQFGRDPDSVEFDLDGFMADEALGRDPRPEGTAADAAGDEQVARARESLALKQRLDAMEDAAILQDPEAVAALQEYETTAKQTATLDNRLKAELLNDPEYERAKLDLERSQAQLAAVAGYDN